MATMTVKIFGVFDNEKLIFEGSRKEIAKKFDIRENTMSSYICNKCKLKRKYDVRYLGRTETREVEYNMVRKGRVKRNIKETPEYDWKTNPIGYLTLNLKLYGNTCTNTDPTKYLKELEQQGIKAKVTPHQERTENYIIKNRREKPKTWYLVEEV